jgi:nicotinamidase/pyrazinamidase
MTVRKSLQEKKKPGPGDALIVVDLQNDFLPGGRLAVPHGDKILPSLNRAIKKFQGDKLLVIATRDWHPVNHCSFQSRGGQWPPHCIAETEGAAFAPGLKLPPDSIIISKAGLPDQDAYSGFQGTDLDSFLRERRIKRLFVGGLATDYCVLNTVKDGLKLGYRIFLLCDAVRSVEVRPGDGERALEAMEKLGAVLIKTADVV